MPSSRSTVAQVLGVVSFLVALLIGGMLIFQYWPDIRATLSPAPTSTTEVCTDSIDNDGDGLIDMEDPDCWKTPSPPPGPMPEPEVCNDGIDNDLDGYIDMEDPDCW